MPGPGLQDFIFQHPLTPEFGLDGDIKKSQYCLVLLCLPKYPKIHVKIFPPWLQDSSFQHLLDHKAGPEGGNKSKETRPLFSNTLLSLKLALRVVSENANNNYSEG